MLARTGQVLGVIAGLLLLAVPVGATDPQPSSPTAPYVQALRVADLFLTAWAQQQPEAGLALMSDALLARDPDSSRVDLRAGLRQYMTGLSNPHHEGFEIGLGSPIGPARVAFPVRLYELYSGEPIGYAYSDTLELTLQRGEWRVDRLPRTQRPD